ncbi:MAG: bifunctional diaminohydroxyphosphoribosylaminopyrimidine deaminase/5-amino-6-(5-phosphoribosylamino)uracil reductase RibD [Alphaproteobacteria bacterium]|nr:bifunctional diaminohydroxyphosphoribosylaminopyrimidine deaminase/5-amino-6-(5-phosphoribosylamino)uracil reductase RibD [Alphaproteobacteria bacterium]
MALALNLARRGLGRVWPNPAVGCVIVKDGNIVGRGWTQDGGRPHAETEALHRAGQSARGATAYVTLEPCAHHGKTPPCAEALIAAGVSRVVSALEDPDPRVAGKGHAILRAANITVDVGTRANEARTVNAGFLSRITKDRPTVALKLATTLDGKIALSDGTSRWITGERARAHVHLLRAQFDAVMIGAGTAVADDPELTSRLPGMNAGRIVRIVVDTNARLSPTSKLANTAHKQPVWMLTAPNTKAPATLGAKAVEAIHVPAAENGIDLSAALKILAQRGLTRIFVEGGATLAASLVKADLVDNLLWYRAPAIMGEGISALGSLSLGELASLPRFRREETIRLGEDVLETYARAH